MPAILSRLRAVGIDLTEDDVRRVALDTPATGRPHVADALVAAGVVADRAEAFERYLSPGRPGYATRYAEDLEDMVPTVVAAGGVPVIAHPWARTAGTVLTEAAFADLASLGLAGIEVDHQGHAPWMRDELRGIARNLGLVVTGSSDFHGAGKVDHDLGCNTTDPDEYARILELAAAARADAGRSMSDFIDTTLLTEAFVTLFVIMDPVGTVPIFLSLTSGRSKATARRAAWQAVAVSFVVITAFAFFGQRILGYLHISLPALQAAGGLLLLLVALELLTGNEKEPTAQAGTQHRDGAARYAAARRPRRDRRDHAVLPAGPRLRRLHRPSAWPSSSCTSASGRRCGYSLPILRLIRESGVLLVTRIAGLLLSAIAVQLVADAVRAFIAGEG